MKLIQLICPECGKSCEISDNSESLTCKCGYAFSINTGIISFVDQDPFYEGKFDLVRVPRYGLFKKLYSVMSISASEYRTWQKARKTLKTKLSNYGSLKVLNLAAGGGDAFLNEMGDVVSLDLSFISLLGAKQVSDFCIQADARKLPFPDNYFDLVFSSHFLGHLPLSIKDACIKEIYRVTKKGGFTLHSAETDADNFIFNAAKKYPELYQKNFVEMYGHHGLETFSSLIKRFELYSFKPVFEVPDYCVGIVRQANSYRVFFGDPNFQSKSLLFRFLFKLSDLACKNKIIELGVNVVLRPFVLVNRIFGPNSVDSVKLMYVKT